MIGGYKIIDLRGINLVTGAEAPPKISGIYDAIESGINKPLMLSGIVINGINKQTTYVNFTHADNIYSYVYDGVTISINSDDEITIA